MSSTLRIRERLMLVGWRLGAWRDSVRYSWFGWDKGNLVFFVLLSLPFVALGVM